MFEKPSLSDHRKILKFESEIFHVPFLLVVPKLYRDRQKCTECHRVLREGKKLIGAYAAYETSLITPHGDLKAVGIGSVAVAKSHRGKGIMSQIMQFAEAEAKENGVDIAFLSGYRKRYERFGYIPCGEKYIYDITEHYIKHNNTVNYKFKPLKKCRNELKNITALYETQGMRWLRKESEFELIAATWFDKCLVIFDSNNNFSGYLIADHTYSEVTEILLCDKSRLSEVLVSYAKSFSKKSISAVFQPWQREYIKEISSFGEHFKVQASAMFKFFSFKNIIEKLMNTKLEAQRLCGGSLTLSLGEEKLKITVKDNVCEVEEYSGEAEIVLDYAEAMTALTTHFYDTDNALFKAWAPMCPLAVPNVDMV